jgi:hypothetical protein
MFQAVFTFHYTLCRSQWPLACWDCGFEFRRGHGCVSLVSVVLSGWGLFHRLISPPRVLPSVACLSGREASIMRRLCLTTGCGALGEKLYCVNFLFRCTTITLLYIKMLCGNYCMKCGYSSTQICTLSRDFSILTFKNRASHIQDGRTATLQMLHFIYFFSTNISTEHFKHAAHSSLFSSKCRLFHNATFFCSCIIHILHTVCAKI